MWGNAPFTFARRYVMAVAQVTDDQARRAVAELEHCGSMVRVGMNGRSILWRPGPTLAVVLGSEDAVVAALIEAFDAEELS